MLPWGVISQDQPGSSCNSTRCSSSPAYFIWLGWSWQYHLSQEGHIPKPSKFSFSIFVHLCEASLNSTARPMLLPSSLPFTSCFFSFSKPHEKDQPTFFRSHLRAGCCRYQRSGCLIWESICISEISKICFQLPCFFDLLWFRNLSTMRNILECSFRNSFPRFRLAGLSFFQGMHLQHGKPSGCQLHLHSYIPYHIQPRQGGCGSASFFQPRSTWKSPELHLAGTWGLIRLHLVGSHPGEVGPQ